MPDLKRPNINSVILSGNVTRDPAVTELKSGTSVCNFGLAVTERFQSSGEWKEKTHFVDCKMFGPAAEYASKKFKKGYCVLVEGKLDMEEWQDKEGKRRNRMTIIAHRVQSLQWDDERAQKTSAPRKADDDVDYYGNEPEVDEDGIPF